MEGLYMLGRDASIKQYCSFITLISREKRP